MTHDVYLKYLLDYKWDGLLKSTKQTPVMIHLAGLNLVMIPTPVLVIVQSLMISISLRACKLLHETPHFLAFQQLINIQTTINGQW